MKNFLAFIAVLSFSFLARAEMRPIFIPGQLAVIIMQGASASGFDPEPRALFDALAVTAQDQDGGKGKGVKTASEDFVLVCGARGTNRLSVVCTINLKPSERSKIDYMKQTADIEVTGDEAKALYQSCAGTGATDPFIFQTQNGWLQIQSTPERFHFRFAR
jgi:hypothetical protein